MNTPSTTPEPISVKVTLDPRRIAGPRSGDFAARAHLNRETPPAMLARLISKALGVDSQASNSPITVTEA